MFFLATVAKQCDKCIGVIIQINNLYEKHLSISAKLARSSSIVGIVNALYQYPVASGKQITDAAGTPQTSVNGYLSMLVENISCTRITSGGIVPAITTICLTSLEPDKDHMERR